MIKVDPLISIIVPNYNHEKYLVQRLESIFFQTYQNYEVILLDDCSQDNSHQILAEYAKKEKVAHCIFNETNSGNTFKQWEKGITLAKGDLIWIAETDDYCSNNFLEELIKPFQQDPEIVLAYCQSNRVDEFGKITGNWITHTDEFNPVLFLNDFIMDGNKFIENFLIFKNVIPNASAVIIKKGAINIDKHFANVSEFKYCGDWIFYYKLIVNKKIAFISESLNNFRYHSTSVIAKALKKEERMTILKLDYKMRESLWLYSLNNNMSNITAIKAKNRYIERNFLTYEKAFTLFRTGHKLHGSLLLLTVLDVFFKNYKLRKNVTVKVKKFFNNNRK